MEAPKTFFKQIFQDCIKREGADRLLEWLESTDFFTAPASSRHHLAREGGLCEHSIHVCDRLGQFLMGEYNGMNKYSHESIAIVSLLHDVCKIGCYVPGTRNQKTYAKEKVSNAERWQVKHDSIGDFIWETVPTYDFKEEFVYGHGEKSVYLIRKFMELTDEEAQAIRFHMSCWQEGDEKLASACFERNPLAFFLHIADEAATFLDEKEE